MTGLKLFADFGNFLNLLNNGWNVLRSRGGFDGRVDLVDGGLDDAGRYVIDSYFNRTGRQLTLEVQQPHLADPDRCALRILIR